MPDHEPFDPIMNALKQVGAQARRAQQQVVDAMGLRPTILLKRLPHGKGITLPFYATPLSAGMDLHAAIADTIVVPPGGEVDIPTGFNVAIPEGFEWQIRGRSGLAFKFRASITHGVGTIDSDYRGEVIVMLRNGLAGPLTITRNMRVAQAILAPVMQAALEEVDVLPETPRGTGGFGSTGS